TEDAGLVAEVDTDDEAAQNEIRAAIRRAVAAGSDVSLRHVWLVPRVWLIKTSSGKVARSANRDKLLAEMGEESSPPCSWLRQLLGRNGLAVPARPHPGHDLRALGGGMAFGNKSRDV